MKLLVLNVPLVIVVDLPELVERLDPSAQAPPTPLNSMDPDRVTVLVVMVCPVVVELNVILPVDDHVVAAIKVIDPAMFKVGVVPVAKVTVPAETLMFKQASAPVIVTVYVPAWLKNTESAVVGTEAPPGPPDVADQLVVLVVFQVPVPPTQ